MKSLITYCKYLYSTIYIPLYIYDKDKLIACFPDIAKEISPPTIFLNEILKSQHDISYITMRSQVNYGYLRTQKEDALIVVGPVNSIPYSKSNLTTTMSEYVISPFNIDSVSELFHNIPITNLYHLKQILLFLNLAINDNEKTDADIIDYEKGPKNNTINTDVTEASYNAKEEESLLNPLSIENEFLHCIETGNKKSLQTFMDTFHKMEINKIANDNIRQWKNTFIVTTTLVSRAAIRGGLSPSLSYKLSEVYMKQIERLSDVNAVIALTIQMQRDYMDRIEANNSLATSDSILFKALQYIREHTNRNITVQEVADFLGYSRPYLSKIAKAELGVKLSKLIRRTKLEEAKNLLAYTDKSISQISSYLCFSSQSHFQRAFKDEFDITPLKYRKSTMSN